MSFLEQMITSIYKFQSYPRLIMQKFGKVMGYLLIFTFIVAFVGAIPFVAGYKKMGGITGAIEKYVPEFSIEKGKLQCETIDYKDDIMGVRIYVDNNENVENIDVGSSTTYLLADSDKMIVGNSLQRSVIEFSQFKNEHFNKDMLLNFFGSIKVRLAIFITLAVTTIVSIVFGTMAGLLFLSLLAALINTLFVHGDLKYTDLLKLSVYARTFPTILIMVINILGFAGGSLLYWGLVITYTYLGLKNIKKQEAIILAEF